MALKKFFTADSGGLNFLWKLIVRELSGLSTQLMNWANGRFVQSVNGKSGTTVNIIKDDIGLENVDNTADVNKHVAHAVTAGDADTLDGKHASDFMSKDAYETFESVIATSLNDLDNRKVDKEDGKGLSTNDYTNDEKTKLAGIEEGAQKHIAPTSEEITNALGFTPADASELVDYSVTVTEQGASGDSLKSYVIAQQGNTIGTINIPKDLVVSSGSVVVGNWVNGVFTETPNGTGKAVKLVIANQADPIYINVQDLVDVYTAQQGAVEVQLAISNTNEISATLVQAIRDKINNAIPKVTGATGKVPQFKADGSLESSSFEIKTNVPANAVFTDTIIDNVAGDGIEVSGEHNATISLSAGTKSILANAVSDHTKLGGHTVGTDIPANAVFTDYQTTKEGHYTPTDQETTINPNTSILRDTTRDMAFVGAIKEDAKGHVVGIDTVAILALTNAEIQAIVDQATAEIATEM